MNDAEKENKKRKMYARVSVCVSEGQRVKREQTEKFKLILMSSDIMVIE